MPIVSSKNGNAIHAEKETYKRIRKKSQENNRDNNSVSRTQANTFTRPSVLSSFPHTWFNTTLQWLATSPTYDIKLAIISFPT